MGPSSIHDNFYLYLWRAPNVPGTMYLARGFETTEALCRGLTEDGYIVKVIQTGTDTEFELRAGKLCPTQGSTGEDPSSQGPSSQGMTQAFA
jgi:hypothetical protein